MTLGKNHCVRTRREDFQIWHIFMDIKSRHDCAECLYFKFYNKNQLEYYGKNSSLSKEGTDLVLFECDTNRTSDNIIGDDIINSFFIFYV